MNTEELRKRIRNVIEYWNEDESLLYNECVDCLVNVFKDYARHLVLATEAILKKDLLAYQSHDLIRRGVDDFKKEMLRKIEEN